MYVHHKNLYKYLDEIKYVFNFQVTTQQQSLIANGKRINNSSSVNPTRQKYSSYQPVEEKREAKVTYLTEFELNNQPNIRTANQAELHNGNTGNNHVKNSDMTLEQVRHTNSTTTTQTTATSRHHNMRSEDELSAVSTSKNTFFFSFHIFTRFSVSWLKVEYRKSSVRS